MTSEEKAFAAWWKEWDEKVFGPWASSRPVSMAARAIERQYRATLATSSDDNRP